MSDPIQNQINLPQEQYIETKASNRWKTIAIISLFFIVILFSAIIYLLLEISSFSSKRSINEQSISVESPETEYQEISELGVENWTYANDEKCSVSVPVPPFEEPYTDSDLSMKWIYPSGAGAGEIFTTLINIEENGQDNSSVALYAPTTAMGSGFIASSVSINCVPNLNNKDILDLESDIQINVDEYNNLPKIDEFYGPTKYEIKDVSTTTKWGKTVLKATIDAVYIYKYWDTSTEPAEIVNKEDRIEKTVYITTANDMIFGAESYGMSDDPFLAETSNKILDNLKLN
ncbi:MAG: hypothetical protein COU65_03505 [Candidatus Pacebacteria bacterium CG10_big_fil_rev_8_21_14_0_10_42_12]|nr:MAG: hypothetical protein COU65_03505 [Candidatus Pacebacteria bacterium CG10_big_fil_rev_8_21_14_0_10_42_12]